MELIEYPTLPETSSHTSAVKTVQNLVEKTSASQLLIDQDEKTHLSGIALEAISGFSMCAADYQAIFHIYIQVLFE